MFFVVSCEPTFLSMLADVLELSPASDAQEHFEHEVLADVHLLRHSRLPHNSTAFPHVVLATVDLQKTGSSQLEELVRQMVQRRAWALGNATALSRWMGRLESDPAVLTTGGRCGLWTPCDRLHVPPSTAPAIRLLAGGHRIRRRDITAIRRMSHASLDGAP